MSEDILRQIIIDTIKGEQHLGESLKKQCVDYIEQSKANNINNWNELKKFIEDEITDQKEHFKFICEYHNQEVPDIRIQLEKTDLLIRKLESILSKMQELENRKV